MRRRRAVPHAIAALIAIGAPVVAGCGGEDPPVASPEAAASTDGFRTVDPAAVAGDVRSGDVLLVDVREDDEWEAGHAPRAMHVPLGAVADALPRIRRRADGRPVAFICRTGNRSAEAARLAVDAGMRQVVNVDGGMSAWVAAGLPLEPPDGRVV